MCTRPIPIRYVNYKGVDSVVDAPCGKCFDCLRRYQNDWKIRAIEESKSWSHAYFFTLTYAEDNLPYFVLNSDDTLSVYRGKDLQDVESSCKFSTVFPDDIKSTFKRFRINVERLRARELGVSLSYLRKERKDLLPKFSYFLCSEYGPNGTQRPHYHGLLFCNMPRKYSSLLFQDWRRRFGFVKVSRLVQRKNATNKASAAANYVAKYCSKGVLDVRLPHINDGLCLPCFRYVSHNFGAQYIENNREYHIPSSDSFRNPKQIFKYVDFEYVDLVLSRCHYYDGKFKYSLPRYYYERIFYEKIKRPHSLSVDKKSGREVVRYSVRYAPYNSLCDKMSYRLRALAEARYRERFENAKIAHPGWSDSEVHLFLTRCDSKSREGREKKVRDNLSKFYFENKLKNKLL